MNGPERLPAAPPLAPQEIDRLLAMDPQSRAEWMLEDCARFEEAWGLENADGWVLFELGNPPEGGSPWALPLWPRQELAALASRGADETPRAIPLEELLDQLLPEVASRGWRVAAMVSQGQGYIEPAPAFAARLAEAWEELSEEEG